MLLQNAESLGMLRGFGKEDAISTEASEIEGLLSLVGLNTFIDEVKEMLKESSPLLLQAYTLFISYKKGIKGLYIEALNSLSADELARLFDQDGDGGVVGVGVDNNGNVSQKITKEITDYSKKLLGDSEKTSLELPKSAMKLLTFIATMQRTIFDLLEQSQQNKLEELEEEEKAEKIVTEHLSNHSQLTQETGKKSIEGSKAGQIERMDQSHEKKEGILDKLEELFNFSNNIFKPAQRGIPKMMKVDATA